jgi:hypothetical protein
MPSFESINEKLQLAAEKLDQAATEIRDLPLEPTETYIRKLGESLVNIFEIQHEIYRLRPDLQPDFLKEETPRPDPELTSEQMTIVEKLSANDIQKIDELLLSCATQNWRKVAMVVALAMSNRTKHLKGIPDLFYSLRIRKLVEGGLLESQGNLECMRFSEVRIPCGKDE